MKNKNTTLKEKNPQKTKKNFTLREGGLPEMMIQKQVAFLIVFLIFVFRNSTHAQSGSLHFFVNKTRLD